MAELLVPIARFRRPIEAELAKSKLEAEGLHCFVAGGRFAHLPLDSGPAGEAGSMRLLVRQNDEDRAREILDESPDQAEAALREVFEELEESRCPRCGSAEIKPERATPWTVGIALLLVGLLVGRPLLILLVALPVFIWLRRRCRCFECGHRWREG